jgi:hypothetical protein
MVPAPSSFLILFRCSIYPSRQKILSVSSRVLFYGPVLDWTACLRLRFRVSVIVASVNTCMMLPARANW